MRRACYFSILSIAVILLSCSVETVRSYVPVERSDVQLLSGRAGIIRTSYCNFCIENVDRKKMESLLQYRIFRGKGKGFPSNACFSIMVSNVWDKPVQVNRIEIISGGELLEPEFFDFINDRGYGVKRYSVNFNELWKTRRLLTDALLLSEIDFENDTIEYNMNYILPGDSIIFFRTFRWIPAGNRDIKLRIGIKYHEMEKVIDFDIAEFEYYESEPGETTILPEVVIKNENR